MLARNSKYSVLFLIVCNLLVFYLITSFSFYISYFMANIYERPTHKQIVLNRTLDLLKILKKVRYYQERVPSLKHENLKRRIKANFREYEYFVFHEGFQLFDAFHVNPETVQDFVKLVKGFRRSLSVDFEKMTIHDGFEKTRHKVMTKLTDLFQKRIRKVQNPRNCSTSKRLICNHRNECGLGCDVHNFANAFALSYALNRTLLVEPKEWIYHHEGYEEIFLPFSETCINDTTESSAQYPDQTEDDDVVFLGTTYYQNDLPNRPKYFPTVVPDDIAPILFKYHGDPAAWWVGQFVKYLLRLQPHIENIMDLNITSLGHKRPIVGIQVRRTDKIGGEAGFYELDLYMKAVDDYYTELELYKNIEKRRIYIASDDPSVIDEAFEKYGFDYEILTNKDVVAMANVSTRYTDFSLLGLILSVKILSTSDFIVCTLTSQVCRMAFEVMQTLHPDASSKIFSLDSVFYFNEDPEHRVKVILPHKGKAVYEVTAKEGDILETYATANFTMGWAFVKEIPPDGNTTSIPGKYIPKFKVSRVFRSMKFPNHDYRIQKEIIY